MVLEQVKNGTKSSKKKSIIIFALVIGVLFLVLGYGLIHYAEKRVQENLLEALKPVQALCDSTEGCASIPPGWREVPCPRQGVASQDLPSAAACASPPETSAYRTLVYRATKDAFVVRWRYVTDTELVVYGKAWHPMQVNVNALDAPNS